MLFPVSSPPLPAPRVRSLRPLSASFIPVSNFIRRNFPRGWRLCSVSALPAGATVSSAPAISQELHRGSPPRDPRRGRSRSSSPSVDFAPSHAFALDASAGNSVSGFQNAAFRLPRSVPHLGQVAHLAREAPSLPRLQPPPLLAVRFPHRPTYSCFTSRSTAATRAICAR